MKNMKALLLLFGALPSVYGDFFHEPSRTELNPGDKPTTQSDFGFSLAYQDSASPKLVVGAPRHDFVGKVYSCPLKDLSNAIIDCSMIDMKSLEIEKKTKRARNIINPDQNFFFGSSIAATPDYFLTCAPLLTKTIKSKGENTDDAFGACFLYNDTAKTYSEWKDNGVRLANHLSDRNPYTLKRFTSTQPIRGGGLGWSTLADKDNGYLMAVKTAYLLDFVYVDINHPLAVTSSFLENSFDTRHVELNLYFNTGYGLAIGNFFNQTVKLYAVSFRYVNLVGKIFFLEKIEKSGLLDIMHDPKKSSFEPYLIDQRALGTMFGYALGAADINQDGLSELFVGDPAHVDDLKEFGAFHIYVGGDLLSRNDKNRMRTVLANKENGRFGSAIATNDIDGDNIAEIFVSAPFENSEYGVVYVISGYELNQALFRDGRFKQIRLSELRRTQAIRGDDGSKHFGFSLQMVKDVDGNGCDELAVGSPASGSVRLLRCLPAVNTSISIESIGDEIVKEDAKSIKLVTVCFNLTLSPKCSSVVGTISVDSSITGGANIVTPRFLYELTKDRIQGHCENVTVYFNSPGSGDYTFSTKLDILNVDMNGDRSGKDFKPWAVLSPHSETVKSRVIRRFCTEKECEPKLSYEMFWSGGDTAIDTSITQNETLSIVVNNTGHDAISTYVRLFIHGARISPQANQCFQENGTDSYNCPLPNPLSRNSSFTITLVLNMSEPINIPKLDIKAQLYDDAFSTIHYEAKHLEIKYLLATSPISLTGSKHDFHITDKDLKENIDISSDSHEYHITNDGSVTWVDVLAVLKVTNKSFIMNVKPLTTEVCQQQSTADDYSNFVFLCNVTLKPGAVKKIIASINMSEEIIKKKIALGGLSTSSMLSLTLLPTNNTLHARSSTRIIYKEILTVGNNKTLIIFIVVVVAIILLLLLIFALYRYGFFKRAQKQKLDVLRESVRRRSVRLASESGRTRKLSTADGDHTDHCDIEVVEDSEFQDVDITPSEQNLKDNVMLIKETAQVHI